MNERKIDLEHKAPDGHWEVRFSRQDDIVFSTMIGRMVSEDADILSKLHRELEAKIGKRYRHVMDITDYERDEPEVRKKMQRATLGDDSPWTRFAVVGGNFAMRAMFNLFSMVSKIPMKMFATEADALAWISEK